MGRQPTHHRLRYNAANTTLYISSSHKNGKNIRVIIDGQRSATIHTSFNPANTLTVKLAAGIAATVLDSAIEHITSGYPNTTAHHTNLPIKTTTHAAQHCISAPWLNIIS